MKNPKKLRLYALCLLGIEFIQIVSPNFAYGLTSGPSQPEMQQFTPIGASDMVDLFTGDFSYNIPLMDVEGFPINLAYSAGISNDQEATWVGLGWNINPGVIDHSVRGVPDDFDGDIVKQKRNIKDNWTVGLNLSAKYEVFGWDLLDSIVHESASIFYNNYKSFGYTLGIGISSAIAGPLNGSLNLSVGNQSGLEITPSIGLGQKDKLDRGNFIDISSGLNSREGIKAINFGSSYAFEPPDAKSKKDRGLLAVNSGLNQLGSVSISFSKPVFMPALDMPMENYAFSFNVSTGAEYFANFPAASFGGYFYLSKLQNKEEDIPAYGLINSDVANYSKTIMLDFAREKDISVRESSANIAIPYSTFDVYNISGHDVTGSYHAVRNDMGVFHDPYNVVSGLSVDGGIELGVGNVAHNGFNIHGIFPKTITGKWENDNKLIPFSKFTNLSGSDLYEPVYFKNAGEMPVDKGEMYGLLGKDKISRVQIVKSGSDTRADHTFLNQGIYTGGGSSSIIDQNIQNHERMTRQQTFSYLSAKEAAKFGLEKKILSYPINETPYLLCSAPIFTSAIDSLERNRFDNDHHISEITITQPNGKRYIYGIPAYNIVQKEYTFAVDPAGYINRNTGVTSYASTDTTIDNSKGKDHYFDYQETPPYAHSYLLTAVLSPDYVDNTGNGVSIDDKGQAYKLNYSKLDYTYKWRTPIDSATFQEGLRSVSYDDKGSIVYGEKEIWYVHSIESKNFVAQFILSDRNDGLGVNGEGGGKNTSNKLKKLDKIELYSKSDLLEFGNSAIPIKTVWFEYDYSLCKGIKNQVEADSGKLTLKRIYFTYGNNTNGILNPYVFNYDEGNINSNPDYQSQNYDKWGNYSDISALGVYWPDSTNLPTKPDFPYTIQDKSTADKFSSVWSLRSIELPSGGTINISYESDDYAFVQNKRAAQMMFVEGFGVDSLGMAVTNTLWDGDFNHPYMYIKLPQEVNSRKEFFDLYLSGLENLYYKFSIDVNKDGEYEYIKGYCKWENYGIGTGGPSDVAWLKISEIDDDVIGSISPVAINAWQSLRLNLPEKAYPGSDISDGDPLDIAYAVLTIIPDFFESIFGFNNVAKTLGKGRIVDLDKSWVRLNNPSYQKFGGGHRVKRITISDNWNEMESSQESFSYGQDYTYTTIDPETGNSISSGVASYEPALGSDENPFHNPVYYTEKNIIAPDNNYYTELPLGESLFPSSSVGYSEVKVSNIAHDGVSRTATGYSISKFYTAKEFPVIARFTEMFPVRVKPNPILSFLKINVKDALTCSQGFYIEVNDMHGKPKEESVYDETGFEISSKQYYYKVDDPNSSTLHLDNNCKVIYPDGSIGSEVLGLDFELYQDMREQQSISKGGGVKVNVDLSLPFPFIPLLGIWPSYTSSDSKFRSTGTTKFIKRYGILKKIQVTDKGSTITTENLAYDSETGQVLLSKVNNEFEDPIYKFNYPAHWIYDGMGPAYENLGGEFRDFNVVDGQIVGLDDPELYFKPGDEVAVLGIDELIRLTVVQRETNLILVDDEGKPYTRFAPYGGGYQPVTLKILRSGDRNLSSLSAGSIVSLVNPMNEISNTIEISDATKIISADAVVYSENWQIEKSDKVFTCDSIAPLDNVCLAEFMDSLFRDEDNFYIKESDSVKVADLSDVCYEITQFAGVPFYFLSNVGPYQVFDDTSSIVPPTYKHALCDFDLVMGDCHVYFYTTYDFCLPLLDESYLDFSATVEDGVIQCQYEGPTAVWMGDTLHSQQVIGYMYSSCKNNCGENCIPYSPGDTVNPYKANLLGVWRPLKSYAYNNLRTPSTATFGTDTRTDGSFNDFDAFYGWNETTDVWDIDSSSTSWIWTTESTKFDKRGNEVESKNALNIYSTALFGYQQSAAKAVANNAKLNQVINDNFEDYLFDRGCRDACGSDHWSVSESLDPPNSLISDDFAHTGNYSLKVKNGESISVTSDIDEPSGGKLSADTSLFSLGGDPTLPAFSPTPGKYLFSAWVRVDSTCHCSGYNDDFVEITYPDATGDPDTIRATGPIIEGWQRLYGILNIPSDATSIVITFNGNAAKDTYFDDIRLHPYLGNMKAFVYDRKSMRLMAELDENNYATFYEYDDEGNLVRVKRETEKGVVTVSEGRSKLKSNL